MRSKIAAILVGGAFLLGGAPMALAKTAQHQFWGAVSQLDSTAKTLAVRDHVGTKGKEMTFTLDPGTKIMHGSKARSFSELKIGEQVKVSYSDQGSAHQAKRIEVLPAKTAKALPSKKTPSATSKSSY